ncbi:MAG: GH92 family glycosyl hydrolase [Flavobacteriaceae bacterium]
MENNQPTSTILIHRSNYYFFTLLFLFLISTSVYAQQSMDYVSYVNPLIGSDSSHALSNGNTYPAIAVPFGMNFWTPQTGKMGDGWIYTHKNQGLVGFRQTHQPSPWINDYGAFSLMPMIGELKLLEHDRQTPFENTVVKPYYYETLLTDTKIKVALTPTSSVGHFRFTFPKNQTAHIVVDAFFKGSSVKIDFASNRIYGVSKNSSGGTPENFANYFVIEFDTPFDTSGTWNGSGEKFNEKSLSGSHVGAYVSFNTANNSIIEAKVTSSFISHAQALVNLNRELEQTQSFNDTKDKAKEAWNNELSKIHIESPDKNDRQYAVFEDNLIKFYSSFYRSLLFPRAFHEYNENGKQIHYSPYNGEICDGPLYTDNGFWDTFRAVFPFYNLLYPEKMGEIIQGIMVNPYKESGWLPEWSSPGHRDCMIGSNSASIIAEAYLKGARDFDIETAYEAILNSSKNEGPLSSVGRKGAKEYNSLGYIPYDVSVNESVARTLEYAYNDFCIMRLAEELDKPQKEINLFKNRALNYKNVFDKTSNFMRGKSRSGDFEDPFNPFKWGGVFTEGSAWHYTWSVLHDFEGLINLMGGRLSFGEKMDAIFSTPPTSDHSYYGFKIHEILEMELIEMGQYAHGNQPIQHVLYLYNYINKPWKTQEKVRYVMDNLYGSGPDGYCGDEDNGQTSAWFLFSALGFYPVAPITGEYIIGSPLFEEVTVKLSNGNKIKIQAKGNSKERIYVQQIRLNGKKYGKNWFDHDDLINGGNIDFRMSKTPNFNRGTDENITPYSMSKSAAK